MAPVKQKNEKTRLKKQRQRARLRENPEKYDLSKEKDKLRNRQAWAQRKKMVDTNPGNYANLIKETRAKNRERKQKSRTKLKLNSASTEEKI